MTNPRFNIAQEDSLEKVEAAYRTYLVASVDAEVADRRFASALHRATVLDLLTTEQIAEGTGISIDDLRSAVARSDQRSEVGDDGFAERHAAAYPEAAAAAERKRAIRAARGEQFRRAVAEERRAQAGGE